MPITLRNKVVEDKIRRIGERTGEGPSAVIARAIEQEEARIEAEAAQKLADLRAIRESIPPMTDEERAAVQREVEHMFDYLYEDEAPVDAAAAEKRAAKHR
jgi:hypothetical protein